MFGLEAYIPGEIFGLQLYRLAEALVIFIAVLIVAKIVEMIVNRVFKRIAEKTHNTFDDAVLGMIDKSIVPVSFVIALYLAFHSLGIQDAQIVAQVDTLFYILATGIIALIFIRFVDVILKEIVHPLTSKTDTTLDDQLMPILRKGAKALIGIFAAIVIMDRLGFDVTALIAGLGVGGLALAFAAKESIGNLFGGISLILDKTITVGDKIEINGTVGIIKEIGLRSTRVRTYDNEEVIFPNAQVANTKIKNYAKPDLQTRGNVEFTVVYGSDVDTVKKVVMDELNSHEKVLKDPKPGVIFYEMGDFALKFKARFWVKSFGDVYGTKLQLTDSIYKRLNKERIGIPFPTQTIHLEKE